MLRDLPLTLTILFVLTGPTTADDLNALTARLEARNAEKAKAKPKAGCPCDLLPAGCACTPQVFCEGGNCPAAPKGPKVGDRSFYQGKWWTFAADGWWYADSAPVSPATEFSPATTFPQPRAQRPFVFPGASCGAGG